MGGNLKYFFVYETDLPADVSGFSLFGPWHLFWLILLVALCIALSPVFRRLTERAQLRFGRILTACMLVIEGCNDVILVAIGHFEWQHLPLHLCGLAIFVCFAHAVRPMDWSAQTLYCMCLPGAAAALIFPDWTSCPPLQYENLHGFVLHTMLVLYPVLQIASGRIRPRLKSVWKPAIFLGCAVLPLYFLNHVWGTNFMFINWPSAGSPLEAIAAVMGNPGYLLGYAALVAAIVLLMYVPWVILYRIRPPAPR